MTTATAPAPQAQQTYIRTPQFYDRWMEAQGIPVYRDYYIEDGRTLELGYWKERGHNAAFLQLAGQEGVSEARITEVPAGGSVPPYKMTLEDVVYVLSGRGVATVWQDGGEKHSFEWTDHAMFRIPGNYWVEYASMSGGQPARLLHYNNMPIAMSAAKDASIFFNTPLRPQEELRSSDEFYSDAVMVDDDPSGRGMVRQ